MSLPHARGGVSFTISKRLPCFPSSPRTWGCFSREGVPRGGGCVFPTHVGVFLHAGAGTYLPERLPHARGGVSGPWPHGRPDSRSSPRTWGCFQTINTAYMVLVVFPTHVGVFLAVAHSGPRLTGLPHARGGVSAHTLAAFLSLESSPRTWGCFLQKKTCGLPGDVFPTHVGVFRTFHSQEEARASLPHARGGVSILLWLLLGILLVFPTHVGVFPHEVLARKLCSGLPHARGVFLLR